METESSHCGSGCATPNCSVFASTGACCYLARRESKLGWITKKWLRSLLGLLQDCLTGRSLQLRADKGIYPLSAHEQLCDCDVLCPGMAMAVPRTGFVRCVTGGACTAPEDGNRHPETRNRWQHTAHPGHLTAAPELTGLWLKSFATQQRLRKKSTAKASYPGRQKAFCGLLSSGYPLEDCSSCCWVATTHVFWFVHCQCCPAQAFLWPQHQPAQSLPLNSITASFAVPFYLIWALKTKSHVLQITQCPSLTWMASSRCWGTIRSLSVEAAIKLRKKRQL